MVQLSYYMVFEILVEGTTINEEWEGLGQLKKEGKNNGKPHDCSKYEVFDIDNWESLLET